MAETTTVYEEEKVNVETLLELAQMRFELYLSDELIPKDKKEEIRNKLMKTITDNNMAPYYEYLSSTNGSDILASLKTKSQQQESNNNKTSTNYPNYFPRDENLISKMVEQNKKDLEQLDAKIKDAQENFGETEVREALLAKALYYVKIGDKENALTAFRLVGEKTFPLGQRLDLAFARIRLGFAFNDQDLVSRNIELSKTWIEEGGDWERRNRLKVYEGTYCMTIRNFKKAAQLFLESIATFSSNELMTYTDFVKYTVITSILTITRPELKKKVINASEILAVIDEVPHLADFLNSLYNCQYKLFFSSMVEISLLLQRDRILARHAQFYIREIRILSYSQFLESYRSVTLDAMGKTFGVSTSFLDRDLSRFIATARLNCKIDKVGGVIETNRPDAKNSQYQTVIKQGDILLNRIQKLSRVMDI